MPTPRIRRRQQPKRRPWLAIAVEALAPLVGRTVSQDTVRKTIARHPDARTRARLESDAGVWIDDAVWKLEAAGLLITTERDRVRVHVGLAV